MNIDKAISTIKIVRSAMQTVVFFALISVGFLLVVNGKITEGFLAFILLELFQINNKLVNKQ